MNDFQIYTNKYSKLSLHKNNNKKKMRKIPPSLKYIFYNNKNDLEISSQYSNYQNPKNKKLYENYKYKHTTYNNNNGKNISFPFNSTSSNKSINSKIGDGSLNNLKKQIELFYSKKADYLNKKNSKENTFNNITNISHFKGLNGKSSKHNIRINALPRKSNLKLFFFKENNKSINSNNYLGKSLSKSKSNSNSKSQNKMENKSYNSKINNNINKIIIDNYLKLYKNGEKDIGKKNTRNKLNFLYKEYPRNNSNKYSNENQRISPKNILNNLKLKCLKKKNKSSNLLITNFNKSKNKDINSKICIFAYKKKRKNKLKNNKIDSYLNNKKFFMEEKIIHLINKMQRIKKKSSKNKNDKKISPKHTKNNKNKIINIIITKAFNNNNNHNTNKYLYDKNQNKENKDNFRKEGIKEAIIYDYSNNNMLNKKSQNINEMNAIANSSKKNIIINTQSDNEGNLYKLLNERLKTEYNDNSLEAFDKMYEDDNDNDKEKTQKSKSLSKRESYKFLYPEIYMKDDEFYLENDNDDDNYNNSNDKKEKELDETESPLKIDTYKENNENSGILSYDEVKDIICYYDMNSRSKKNDFLFKINEREIYDINSKNKYLNFFFENNKNSDSCKDRKNNNENSNDLN
jgi:hypothetical protein